MRAWHTTSSPTCGRTSSGLLRETRRELGTVANLLTFKAAWLYDNGKECGAEANSAKYLGARYAYDACERAILTHGGYGYAKEFYVERLWREVRLYKIAPVSQQMVLNHLAEHVLGLPKSY